jgi:hypothetical protein
MSRREPVKSQSWERYFLQQPIQLDGRVEWLNAERRHNDNKAVMPDQNDAVEGHPIWPTQQQTYEQAYQRCAYCRERPPQY